MPLRTMHVSSPVPSTSTSRSWQTGRERRVRPGLCIAQAAPGALRSQRPEVRTGARAAAWWRSEERPRVFLGASAPGSPP